jgi:RNA polymerase sigma-70 factor (ECF subfamily)
MSEPERAIGIDDLVGQRPFLVRLARLQLGDEHEAEDAVQETLIAAASGLARFSGQVAVRAWLTGILKHKVVDLLRQRQRHRAILASTVAEARLHAAGEGGGGGDGGDLLDDDGLAAMFNEAGDWHPETFVSTACPRGALERRQQLDLLELCLHLLPEHTGRIFLMREYLGMEMDEIAAEAALKSGHVRVIVHRARLKLRACVVRGWGEDL